MSGVRLSDGNIAYLPVLSAEKRSLQKQQLSVRDWCLSAICHVGAGMGPVNALIVRWQTSWSGERHNCFVTSSCRSLVRMHPQSFCGGMNGMLYLDFWWWFDIMNDDSLISISFFSGVESTVKTMRYLFENCTINSMKQSGSFLKFSLTFSKEHIS